MNTDVATVLIAYKACIKRTDAAFILKTSAGTDPPYACSGKKMTHIFGTAGYDHRHDVHKQVLLNGNKPSGRLLFRQSVLAMETGKLVPFACAEALREGDLVYSPCLGNAENAH